MMPRSAGEVSTAPTAARCPLAASRSSANVAMTEPAPAPDHARRTVPSSSRTSEPVMPWAEGSPPEPIVVKVAAGSRGTDPVTASMVPAPSRMARRTNGHAPGAASRSGVPTPFHAMTTTRGEGLVPSVITPGSASPVRTSGWGRRRPETTSRVGAIASRPTPSGIGPAETPPPRNTMGTRMSVVAPPEAAPGHATRTRSPNPAATVPTPSVAAITSGERPSRNPAAIVRRNDSGSGQNGTTEAASVPPASQLFPTQNTRSTMAGAPTSASTSSKVESRRPMGTAPRYRAADRAPATTAAVTDSSRRSVVGPPGGRVP